LKYLSHLFTKTVKHSKKVISSYSFFPIYNPKVTFHNQVIPYTSIEYVSASCGRGGAKVVAPCCKNMWRQPPNVATVVTK
jgi:hypothetical protein